MVKSEPSETPNLHPEHSLALQCSSIGASLHLYLYVFCDTDLIRLSTSWY